MHKITSVDPNSSAGICSECGSIKVRKEKQGNGKIRYRCNNASKLRERRTLNKRYGIDTDDYQSDFDSLLEKQGGVCVICQRLPGPRAALDHDHSTGKPRGVLCSACNRGIGMLGDDPERIRRALDYLTRPV